MAKTAEVKTTEVIKRPVNADSIEGMTKDTDKMVRGTFVNIETPGQTFAVNLKLYKGMSEFHKVFEDQEVCTIPLSVARYINERCYYTRAQHAKDENGDDINHLQKHFRCKFMVESFA